MLTKSATPGNIKVTFGHTSVGNKSLGETATTFVLAGYLESPMVVSIDARRAFTSAEKKIRLLFMEAFIHAAVGDLVQLKKLRDWASLNAILLPPLLTKAVVLDGETLKVDLIKFFASMV